MGSFHVKCCNSVAFSSKDFATSKDLARILGECWAILKFEFKNVKSRKSELSN